jgi:hypothetical protein
MFSVVTIMKSLTYLAIILLLSWFLITQARKPLESCEFQAIFNFGDSNSDTGSMSAAFYPATLPYGETFFHEAVGRSSNGRLIIDFIGKQFYSLKHFIYFLCMFCCRTLNLHCFRSVMVTRLIATIPGILERLEFEPQISKFYR